MSSRAYRAALETRYWTYWRARFERQPQLLRPRQRLGTGPPVLRREWRALNVLTPNDPPGRAERVRAEIPARSRHRWFGSFHSSQALAQSVFANLKHAGKLDHLAEIRDPDGRCVFFDTPPDPISMTMEHSVGTLGERANRTTEVDVYFEGAHRVCVECKFTEQEVGSCSRPRLKPTHSNYARDHCDGTYTYQRARSERCALTGAGVRYWEYLPDLLGWPSAVDHAPCPLKVPYQLVRNVLAATVREDGELDTTSGHAVLVYDERNPCFQVGGAGLEAWATLKTSLLNPGLLRRCSWQDLLAVLRDDRELAWLMSELNAKWGL